ncbi:MAG: methionine--tRNA ligase [Desulfurococcales archaeon]|nr:methionine--tRNA ligase [Desulfurococcales archaeon]
MVSKWIVGSAWPYVNSVPHLGNLIGSILSADVFVRYVRLRGDEVVFVSGSDEHGTPIEVEALKKGIEPKKMTDEVHEYVSKLFKEWRISFDNYTRTESPIHKKFVRDLLLKVYRNKYIFTQKDIVPYCPKDGIFLPDRFIEGTCPYCGYTQARGDQCDNCGRLLHPAELINPRCVLCGSKPVFKETIHWFLDLPKLQDKILEWVKSNEILPDNVKNFTLSWIGEGLKPRSVTRDNKWGIPAPFPGAEDKTIYVWFDALLGYISATKEYFENKEEAGKWLNYWKDPSTRVVFFIGKDNIPFHSVIFPALEIASGEDYVLPWTIAATEYLLYEGQKFSKSRGIGIWIDEALEIMEPDYWRFALIRLRPEQRDANFSWKEFYRIINRELCDDIGNLIHRILSFIYKRYGGIVPSKGELDDVDKELVEKIKNTVDDVDREFEGVRLRIALEKILSLAWAGNQYLNTKAPWDKIKSKPEDAATTMWIGINLVYALTVLLAPIIPGKAEEIWSLLNINEPLWKQGRLWSIKELPISPGHKIKKPYPVFPKLPKEFTDPEYMRKIIEDAREKAYAKRPSVLK